MDENIFIRVLEFLKVRGYGILMEYRNEKRCDENVRIVLVYVRYFFKLV